MSTQVNISWRILCKEGMTQPVEEICNEIKALPNQDYRDAEGKIRKIHNKICALTDGNEKQQLEASLNEAAGLGISEELNELMKKNGLSLEVLVLVRNYLTNIPDLAQHLYETEKSKLSEEGLGIVSQKLGPQLEVLGGLKSKQVNVSKPWAIELIKEAPSFQELSRISVETLEKCCEGSSRGERDVVNALVRIAETNKGNLFPPVQEFVRKNAQKTQQEKEKLNEAKLLMKEAQELASAEMEENKNALKEKMSYLFQKLDFPSDWYKQDNMSSEDLLQMIDKEIEKIGDVIESRVQYTSLEEIVAKASGGLALTGVYYSEYAPAVTAGLPILLPPDEVESKNPKAPYEKKYLRFTEEGTAAKFAQNVESSGFNAAIGIVGFSGLMVGQISGAGGFEKFVTDSSSIKTSTSSVSVAKCTRISQHAFRIRQADMKLSIEARKMALSIANESDPKNQKLVARSFFRRHGSHVCGGVHNLGGMFFSIASASSNKKTKTSSLVATVTKRLDTKLSGGFLGAGYGGGGSGTVEVHDENLTTEKELEDQVKLTISYSLKSIGPNADNPVTFGKLLSSNNATWAVIDRGETSSYIPVWELLEVFEETKYKKSASVMEQTWKEDEEDKKKQFDKRKDELKRKAEERRMQFIKEDSRKELEELKTEHLNMAAYNSKGCCPTGGEHFFTRDWMKIEDAYNKAVDLISEDPEVNICKITYYWRLVKVGYTLKCWKASRDKPMTYESAGDSDLFYSEKYYLWKNDIAKIYG